MVLPKRAYAQAPAPDANGWQVVSQGDGKRRWRQHWTDVALPATVDGLIITAAALPVGVATLSAVDRFCTISGRGATGPYVVGNLSGDDTTASINVRAATIDGTLLNTKSSALVNVAIELVER
jgi:hypothetical protein